MQRRDYFDYMIVYRDIVGVGEKNHSPSSISTWRFPRSIILKSDCCWWNPRGKRFRRNLFDGIAAKANAGREW